jgi:hypothetical protein
MKANALQKTLTIATLGFGLAACTSSPGKDSATAALNPAGTRLSKTQKCLSDVAFAGEARLTPAQKDIIDGCAKELLTLANKGDKAMIALDAYQVQKDLLLAKCSTALAKVPPK